MTKEGPQHLACSPGWKPASAWSWLPVASGLHPQWVGSSPCPIGPAPQQRWPSAAPPKGSPARAPACSSHRPGLGWHLLPSTPHPAHLRPWPPCRQGSQGQGPAPRRGTRTAQHRPIQEASRDSRPGLHHPEPQRPGTHRLVSRSVSTWVSWVGARLLAPSARICWIRSSSGGRSSAHQGGHGSSNPHLGALLGEQGDAHLKLRSIWQVKRGSARRDRRPLGPACGPCGPEPAAAGCCP